VIDTNKLSACIAIGAGGALIGALAGWETGPLTLERTGLATLGAVGGTFVALAGCYGASEYTQAKAKSRQQLAAINRFIALVVGSKPRTLSEDLLPDERLAAVNEIGLMGPVAEKAVPALLEVLKLSALDMANDQAVFLASVDALVKVGVVDQAVVSTLETIREGKGVSPADRVETARVAANRALNRLQRRELVASR
jgi:hypothetical protein